MPMPMAMAMLLHLHPLSPSPAEEAIPAELVVLLAAICLVAAIEAVHHAAVRRALAGAALLMAALHLYAFFNLELERHRRRELLVITAVPTPAPSRVPSSAATALPNPLAFFG